MLDLSMVKLARVLILTFALYCAYYVFTVYAADAIFPTAQQSLRFQRLVLSRKNAKLTANALIVGDSNAAYGYAAKSLPGALSFATFKSSYAEIYYGLKRYLERLPPPKCVILTASYRSIEQPDDRFWEVYALNSYYSFGELDEIYETSALVHDFPATKYSKPAFILKAYLYRLRFLGLHVNALTDALTERNNLQSNRRFRRLILENFGSVNISKERKVHEPVERTPTFEPVPLNDEYLKRIVALLNERAIPLHVLPPPINEGQTNAALSAYFESLHQHLRPLVLAARRNTYSGEIKTYPDEFFLNPVHLNEAGARRFSLENAPLFESCR